MTCYGDDFYTGVCSHDLGHVSRYVMGWREGVEPLSSQPWKSSSECKWSCKSRSTTSTSFSHAYICIGLCTHLLYVFSSSLACSAFRWAYSKGRGCSLVALGPNYTCSIQLPAWAEIRGKLYFKCYFVFILLCFTVRRVMQWTNPSVPTTSDLRSTRNPPISNCIYLIP